MTRSQRSLHRAGEGVVTGHLFKIIREGIPLTQRALAEHFGVDTSTVQAWESGRRPLTAVASAQFFQLRRHLLRHGADPALLLQLDVAMEADSVISHALDQGPAGDDFHTHPLSGWVFTRASTHMIAWALNGARPAAVPAPPSHAPRRRGPTPDSPILGVTERTHLFDHLRRFAEIADRAGDEGALLRRQALYLCSYDTRPDTQEWIGHMQNNRARTGRVGWTPQWADERSVATSLTRYGDMEPLHDFIQYGLAEDSGESANLNYWAYWLGLDRIPRVDDRFMADPATGQWDALALLRSLADRLAPGLGCVDLNVHSVWALIASRHGVLAADPELNRDLSERVAGLLDTDGISSRSRRELESVHYGLRLSRQ
ncbi:MAG TPA: transcriptional regulator [Streptomyces sp.]|nr:transcriptional regulator [Streptomyces sp.]